MESREQRHSKCLQDAALNVSTKKRFLTRLGNALQLLVKADSEGIHFAEMTPPRVPCDRNEIAKLGGGVNGATSFQHEESCYERVKNFLF